MERYALCVSLFCCGGYMEKENLQCSVCGGKNIKYISEVVSVQRKNHGIFYFLIGLFSVLLFAAFIVLIAALCVDEDDLQRKMTLFVVGIIIFLIGFIPCFFSMVLNSFTAYDKIETKITAVCSDCGKEWTIENKH